MNAAPVPGTGVDTPEELRARGFEGFARIGMLRDDACRSVPVAAGVWVVLRELAAGVPHFLPRSTAAPWRGQDPTCSADALAGHWVAHAGLLYVSAAPGTGVRHLLQQRVKRFVRHGAGRVVAHWGGHRIWQLAGASSLRIAWRETPAESARDAARELIAEFESRHRALPFACDPGDEDA